MQPNANVALGNKIQRFIKSVKKASSEPDKITCLFSSDQQSSNSQEISKHLISQINKIINIKLKDLLPKSAITIYKNTLLLIRDNYTSIKDKVFLLLYIIKDTGCTIKGGLEQVEEDIQKKRISHQDDAKYICDEILEKCLCGNYGKSILISKDGKNKVTINHDRMDLATFSANSFGVLQKDPRVIIAYLHEVFQYGSEEVQLRVLSFMFKHFDNLYRSLNRREYNSYTITEYTRIINITDALCSPLMSTHRKVLEYARKFITFLVEKKILEKIQLRYKLAEIFKLQTDSHSIAIVDNALELIKGKVGFSSFDQDLLLRDLFEYQTGSHSVDVVDKAVEFIVKNEEFKRFHLGLFLRHMSVHQTGLHSVVSINRLREYLASLDALAT